MKFRLDSCVAFSSPVVAYDLYSSVVTLSALHFMLCFVLNWAKFLFLLRVLSSFENLKLQQVCKLTQSRNNQRQNSQLFLYLNNANTSVFLANICGLAVLYFLSFTKATTKCLLVQELFVYSFKGY